MKLSKIFFHQGTFEAKIFVVNESISSHQLTKLKYHLTKLIFVPYVFTQIIEIQ